MPALKVAPALLLAALSFQLPDTEGVRQTPAEFRQSKAVVFGFIPTDAPTAGAGRLGLPFPMLQIAAARPVPAPTFTRDVAPILYQHCATCHHPGEVAPFPLIAYQDAAKRAKLIATVTASRYMPPWQPEPGYGHFQGERRLPDADIATLRRWAEAGAPQGDPAQLPPAPHFPEGWQLGTPDLTIRMPKPFAIAADGPDQYMCFVIPLHLTADKYVRAMEFRPQTRSVVHHALFLLDSGHIGRQFGESYPCFGTPGFLPSGALGGWTPGMQPACMPDGLQLILRKGSDLVMQIQVVGYFEFPAPCAVPSSVASLNHA